MASKIQKMTPEEENLLSELYIRYHSNIYFYVLSFIKNEDIANDVVSDTFTLACEKLDRLKDHPNRAGWLYAAARNKVREFHRKLQYDQAFLSGGTEPEDICFDSPYGLKNLEITLHGALTPEEHTRFLRYFIWGYTLQEMADLEETTKENLSVRLSRLRAKIRSVL